MKHQALFSSKDNSKKLKCRLLQFLFGTLRVNIKGIGILSEKLRGQAQNLGTMGNWTLLVIFRGWKGK